MHVIVCLDNRNGMMFNHRRQSQDRVLRERVAELSAGANLFMDAYTARQFRQDLPENAIVSEEFLSEAGAGDYCFVEDQDICAHLDRIETLIVFRWNRDYPGDTYLPITLDDWILLSTLDFEGSSHEEITQEVYEK